MTPDLVGPVELEYLGPAVEEIPLPRVLMLVERLDSGGKPTGSFYWTVGRAEGELTVEYPKPGLGELHEFFRPQTTVATTMRCERWGWSLDRSHLSTLLANFMDPPDEDGEDDA